jgi:putative ABC transport system substrate-binding protein
MRRTCIRPAAAAFAIALLGALGAVAQAVPPKIPRVGFCGGFGDRTHIFHKKFVEGMRKRGWIDGNNVQILIPEGTIAPPGIRLRSCEEYMADKSLDVIVGGGEHDNPAYKTPMVKQIGRVSSTPLAKSSTRNVTGLTDEVDSALLLGKRIALLKEATGAENIFFLSARPQGPKVKPGIGTAEDLLPRTREVAKELGVKVLPVYFTKFEDFEPAFRTIAATPHSAAIFYMGMYWYEIQRDGLGVDHFIDKVRLPVMMPSPDWVQTRSNVPIAYGPSMIEAAERNSYFVDRILRGAKPAELPFEQIPYRLGIDVDAARFFGVDIPQSVLLQADILVPPHPRFKWMDSPSKTAAPDP